jgi:hypothetical protein
VAVAQKEDPWAGNKMALQQLIIMLSRTLQLGMLGFIDTIVRKSLPLNRS